MPPAKKSASKSAGRKTSPKAQRKIAAVMHEFKEGELVSGGSGKPVRNPKQAIAIALSEARESGADIPPPRKAGSKSASKKSSPSASKKKRK
jgi:hypothetical protein